MTLALQARPSGEILNYLLSRISYSMIIDAELGKNVAAKSVEWSESWDQQHLSLRLSVFSEESSVLSVRITDRR